MFNFDIPVATAVVNLSCLTTTARLAVCILHDTGAWLTLVWFIVFEPGPVHPASADTRRAPI